MRRVHTYSSQTRGVLDLLGLEVASARRRRGWTLDELGQRIGASPATLRAVERGAPTVSIGTVFEAATILGVDLLADPDELPTLIARGRDRLALLPSRVTDQQDPVNDNF